MKPGEAILGLLFKRFVFLCLLFAGAVFLSSENYAHAQDNAEIAQELEPLLESARDKGLSVIVVSPGNPDTSQKSDGPGMAERALKVRSELYRIISKAPELLSSIMNTLNRVSPDGSFYWFGLAILTAIGGILIGTGPTLVIRNWNRKHFEGFFNPDPQNRAEKISYLMFRATLILLTVSLAFIIAVLVAVIFDSGHGASRGTIGVILVAYFSYRVFRHVIFFNLIAPDAPSHRMLNLDDNSADEMQRVWRTIALFVIIVCSFFVWLALLGLPPDPLKLLVIVSLLLCALIIAYGMLKHKQEFHDIILGEGDRSLKPIWRRVLASQWHIIILAYLGVAWLVSVYRIVLDLPSALAVIGAPAVAMIGAIAIYGLLLIFIDRFYVSRQRRFEERVQAAYDQREREIEAERKALEEIQENRSEDDDEELIINQVMSAKQLEEMPVFKPVFKIVLEEAVGILVILLGLAYIFAAWDISVGDEQHPVTAFIDTLIIAFFGWLMYRAVVVYIDNQLAEEGDDAIHEDGEPGEEMSGKSASRLATLLPLVRNVLIVSILILSVMIILSNLGVDIAPLFAGAGVIGLAVGFGAQTLIRDIFSGGFFLFDDAFRKGEYIELDTIRGTVEKISLRSFQLRHHNGPLHTIPFGEIKQLTNYSRDWVMMKLPLRLTYDTDVERVRKLVKKLGQRLLDHPEVGELFLQPLKSQGVYRMEDSAMIIRVKFMTKPGDQFVTRKVVYAAIRELFEQEGIRFASKEVTVRLADEPAKPLADNEKAALAAAARRIHDDEAAASANQGQQTDDGP
ncbi:MAG: mechanosensitive ion channel family protein [Pseudomonadota bacterium]